MDMNAVVDAYFQAMRERDLTALSGIYAEDAVFILPDGRTFAGREAVCAMHRGVFAAGAPVPAPGWRLVAPEAAAVEITATLPDGSVRHTTNHFSLDEAGKLSRISVYIKTT